MDYIEDRTEASITNKGQVGKTFPPLRRPAWHGNAILKWGGEDVWNE